MKKSMLLTLLMAVLIFVSNQLLAQTIIQGVVNDGESNEPLIGANVIIKNTQIGTVTDLDGSFQIETNESLPLTLVVSLLGYGDQEIEVSNGDRVSIILSQESSLLNEIVVSASRTEERLLESPVSIEKLDLIAIKNASAGDFYDEIANLKGVNTNSASITFNTINTRGFYSASNTRFVQLQDGIDNASAILNFPTGNVVGISELDIANVELVPGAASALYGPNAFNGILLMNSKSPFDYQGLSVQIKQGITEQNETNHYQSYGFRWAQAVSDKFAYKMTASYLSATDWFADNYTTDALNPSNPSTSQDFNGIHLYGDETNIPVALTGFPFDVHRTGFREADLLDNNDASSLKAGAALHYKIKPDLEAIASYQFGSGSTIYQGSQRYALRDFTQQFAKVELKSPNWFLRAWGSFADAGDSYNTGALGGFVNEVLFPSVNGAAINLNDINPLLPKTTVNLQGGWVPAYGLALSGGLAALGIEGGNPFVARSFADGGGLSSLSAPQLAGFRAGVVAQFMAQNLPEAVANILADQQIAILSGTAIYDANGNITSAAQNAISSVRSEVFQRQTPGASFIDDSRVYQVEGNYNFSSLLNDQVDWLVGGNYRVYDLFTDGTILREPVDGSGNFDRIQNSEFGIYTQLSKVFADKFKLTGSIRYDKNENFDGQVSPRVSAVYSFGDNKQHNIRASFQTGFRNPTNQAQYIFFTPPPILLGGTEENASFTYTDDNGNQVEWNLFEPSLGGAVNRFTGEPIDLEYVKPEQIQVFEVGYKGVIDKRFYLDVNYYYNTYDDFIQQLIVGSGRELRFRGTTYPVGTLFFPYTNVPVKFNSSGIDLGMRYNLGNNWTASGNYSFSDFSFDEADLNGTEYEGTGYNPGFNTPEHKIFLALDKKNIVKNLSAGVNFRWQDDVEWISSFALGTVDAYSTVGAYVSYNIPKSHMNLKLGTTNLFKEDYVTNPGSPVIGRTIILTATYDQFGK